MYDLLSSNVNQDSFAWSSNPPFGDTRMLQKLNQFKTDYLSLSEGHMSHHTA